MSKITSLIRRAPKRFTAVVAMVATAIIVPAAVFAWGPDRPTFTYENPANYVTFNSITNNPQVGDERNFVRVREAGVGTYGENVNLVPGKTYEVSMYYHNNAASNLNAGGTGIAKDAKARIQMPGVLQAGETGTITGFISASNANPGTVWDEAKAKTTNAVALRYVQNSAKFTSNGDIDGQTVPNTLFTTGANLGYDSQNGTLPGCNEYAGYITFKFVVDQPNFTIEKQVSTDNKTWVEEVTTTPGSTVYYRLAYKNTGTVQQDNVTVRDILPKELTYVKGSAVIANSSTGGVYKPTIDNLVTNGIDSGSYAPNANVYFKFSAKVKAAEALKCGTNVIKNVARAVTTGGYKEDDAIVKVNKECEPGKISVCELKTKKIITIDEDQFDSKKHSKNSADCQTTPPELPRTGAAENIVAFVGLGSIIAAIAYYVASRRALNQ